MSVPFIQAKGTVPFSRRDRYVRTQPQAHRENATVPPVPRKPKLLDQVRHRCRLRHLARSTEKAYVAWIRRFILFHHKRHPLGMGAKEVGAFLTHLAVAGHVAASTQNQALSELLFLYRQVLDCDFGWLDDVVRANKPKRLPVVFTPEEAMAVIGQLGGVRWLMGMQLYGGGLRLMECLRLRVKDVDFERLQVIVRGGAGRLRRRRVAVRLGPQVPSCGSPVGLAVRVSRGPPLDRSPQRCPAAPSSRPVVPPEGRRRGDSQAADQQARA